MEPNAGILTGSHFSARDLGNRGEGIRSGSHMRPFLSICMVSYTLDYHFRALSPTFKYFNTTGRIGNSGVSYHRQGNGSQESCSYLLWAKVVSAREQGTEQDLHPSVLCFLPSGNDFFVSCGSALPSISVHQISLSLPLFSLSPCLPTCLSVYLSYLSVCLSIYTYM